MRFEYFVGLRYLRAKQKQAFISLITILSIAGVTVGVMALIVVIAVMAGFESDMKQRILGVESHLVLMRYGGEFVDHPKIIKAIRDRDGITAATPFVLSQAMLRSAVGVSGAMLRGIDPDSAGTVVTYFEPETLRALSEKSAAPAPGIILGKELARELGVTTGETIALISPRGMISPVGHLPAMKRFTVVGLFESGMYEFDKSLAYVTLSDAQRLLRLGDSVTGIEIRVNDIYQADRIGESLVGDLGYPYVFQDWMQMNRNLFSALKLEKTVMFIILALIVLVAAFNIASSLIMMVMEKTKDIAILKAMGASNKSVRRIFVFKGMAIGFFGTILGGLLGTGLCALLARYQFIELPSNVYYVATLPVELKLLDVLAIGASALVICFLATLYPSRQASRLDPVEAIRYG